MFSAHRGPIGAVAHTVVFLMPVLMKFSIVVPFHNEEENLPELYARLTRVMEALDDDYELVFVDDGSSDRTHQLLREARDAFRDGLYWQRKAAPSLALLIDAGSFTPRGELPRLGLRADDATRAAQANLRAALKFISKAEEQNRERQ